MAKKPTAAQLKVRAAFKEVHSKTPKAVKATMKKKGKKAAEKQRIAIALSKARKAGAKIPQAPSKKKPITRNDVMNSIQKKAQAYA